MAVPVTAERAFGEHAYPHHHHSGHPKSKLEVRKVGYPGASKKRSRFGHKGLRKGGVKSPVVVKQRGFPYGNVPRRGFHQGHHKPLGFPYGNVPRRGFSATFGQGGVKVTFGQGSHLHHEKVGYPSDVKPHKPHGVRRNRKFRRHAGFGLKSPRYRHYPAHGIYHEPPIVEKVVVVSPPVIQQPYDDSYYSTEGIPATPQKQTRKTPVKFVQLNDGRLDPSGLLTEGIQGASAEDVLGIDLQLVDGATK